MKKWIARFKIEERYISGGENEDGEWCARAIGPHSQKGDWYFGSSAVMAASHDLLAMYQEYPNDLSEDEIQDSISLYEYVHDL